MEETGEIQPKIVLKIGKKCKDKSNIITENRDLGYFHANPDIFETAYCFTWIGLLSTRKPVTETVLLWDRSLERFNAPSTRTG